MNTPNKKSLKALAVVVHLKWDIKRPAQIVRFCSYLFRRFNAGLDE